MQAMPATVVGSPWGIVSEEVVMLGRVQVQVWTPQEQATGRVCHVRESIESIDERGAERRPHECAERLNAVARVCWTEIERASRTGSRRKDGWI
jgi:hypothetical protein